MSLEIDLVKVKDVALEAAAIASKEIQENFYKRKKVEDKEGIANLVTETDTKCEVLIIECLKKSFPDFKIIGEETSSSTELTDEPTWCIDPIDGTTNFIHSYPMIAISIGLLVNKKSTVGVCVNPILNSTYWAIKGKGAYKNDVKINVSKNVEVKDALFSANFPSGLQRTKEFTKLMNSRFEKLMDLKVHGIRMGGAAVMNLVGVAEGSLDCYFETGIQAWDMSAGIIIVEEAGGLACDTSGKPYDVLSHNIVVSNCSNIQKEIIKILNEE
eukprot:gene10704-3326_t